MYKSTEDGAKNADSIQNDVLEPKSSTLEASINMSKLCIGSGILALPYAISKGGLILSPIFIGFIAMLNGISCDMMIECKNAVRAQFYVPDDIISTYSRIAFCGGGYTAVMITDLSIIITLLGACVTYLITFNAMMEDLPFVNLGQTTLAWIMFLCAYPLCVVKDVSKLAKFSLAGLACLLIAVSAIILFGIVCYGGKVMEGPGLPLFSESIVEFATFIGIATFGFGLCSLAFPVEESMAYPQEFGQAVKWSLLFVWMIYVILGDGVAFLFVHDERGINSNILRNLPINDVSAHVVRFAMALVCILTLPLTFIPPAQMIEQLLIQAGDSIRRSSCAIYFGCPPHEFQPLVNTTNVNGSEMSALSSSVDSQMTQTSVFEDREVVMRQPSRILELVNRGVLLLLCHTCALSIPCFGLIISLLGCFTVTILSFVLPPFLSLSIISKRAYELAADSVSTEAFNIRWRYYRDFWMYVVGVVICVVTTAIVSCQCYLVYVAGEC